MEGGLPWFRDPAALRFLFGSYLSWLAGLHLVWEIVQLALYTLWTEANPGNIMFAVLHCTLGDVMIGASALLLSLIAGRERSRGDWRWGRIALGTTLLGVAYTVFSEWMNVAILGSWTYSELMPIVELMGVRFGVSPLLQWAVVPPLALGLARRSASP